MPLKSFPTIRYLPKGVGDIKVDLSDSELEGLFVIIRLQNGSGGRKTNNCITKVSRFRDHAAYGYRL